MVFEMPLITTPHLRYLPGKPPSGFRQSADAALVLNHPARASLLRELMHMGQVIQRPRYALFRTGRP